MLFSYHLLYFCTALSLIIMLSSHYHHHKSKTFSQLTQCPFTGTLLLFSLLDHQYDILSVLISWAFCPPCPKNGLHFVLTCDFDEHFVHWHFVHQRFVDALHDMYCYEMSKYEISIHTTTHAPHPLSENSISASDSKTIAFREFCLNMLFTYFWVWYKIVKVATCSSLHR